MLSREFLAISLVLIALLFKAGLGFQFGIEGEEPILIPMPQSDILANLFFAAAIVWLIPPWIVAKISRRIDNWIKERKSKYPGHYGIKETDARPDKG